MNNFWMTKAPYTATVILGLFLFAAALEGYLG